MADVSGEYIALSITLVVIGVIAAKRYNQTLD